MKRLDFIIGFCCWFLLLITVQYTTSNPLQDPNLCGQPTCVPTKKFSYEVGTKYTYKYSVGVSSLFRGTSENQSTLYSEALVHLTFATPCQGILQITDVSLTSERSRYDKEEDEDIESPSLPRAEDFASAISYKSLRFSFQDGVIEELCPDPEDPVWVLNYKRGLLTAFHNTMVRFDIDSANVEADVNGECVTRYQLLGARTTSLLIEKVKEMASCRSRHKYRAILQTDPYNFGSSFQTVPLVKSRHRCEFSIDRKMYRHIECGEVHTFQPFSRAENGSQSITKQRLSFLREYVTNVTVTGEPVPKRVSLLFDHNATPKPTSGELKASRDLIKTLCRLDTDNVQIGYPDAFTKLVHVGRRLSFAALSQIYLRAGSLCTSGRKHIMDVLPYLGSNAAVAVMVESMNSVPKHVAKEWLVAMAFIPSPDEATLSLLVKLLDYQDRQVLLSVSALTHSFCRFEYNCLSIEPVQKIISYLQDKISRCGEGKLTDDERNEVLLTLKAVGNLGEATPEVRSALRVCVESEYRDMEIRSAAVTAHRRLPCLDSRDYFLDIYRNGTMDVELRIAGYLQVMRCPNYHVISTIRMQLELEEINQVGSFVWSHLQNQLSSAMPTKVEVQTLLTDRLLSEKFNKDRRKFSRSYETSLFFDEYNAGGNMESQVIFSPKSFLPRSFMTNLTLYLFGEAVNVLEVEARGEGFETFIEGIFGPSGPLSQTVVNTQVDKVLRVIRSAAGVVGQVQALPNVIDNNFKVPKLSVGYKIFGNEISYTAISGNEDFRELIDKLNPAKRLKELLSGKEFSYDKASHFLEGDYILPTGIGLPVFLSVVGTSAVHLDVSGHIRNLQLTDLDIEGKLKPSLAIDITGHMGVDAFYASTGIKLKASVYTSTAVDGNIKVNGTNKATLAFNLPREKGDLISLQTKLIVMKGEKEEEQSGITEKRVSANICSWDSLDKTLGLKLCVDAAFPNATSYATDPSPMFFVLGKPPGNLSNIYPSFILSGPALLSVVVHKADPTAEKYVLQYLWEQQKNKTAITLTYDTPGSAKRREMSARLVLDNQSKNLTLLLQGVDNKFEAHGTYKYTELDKYLDFSIDINGKKHLVVQVGLRTKPISHGFNYHPRLLLKINEEVLAELSGSIKVKDKKDITHCAVNLDFKTKKLKLKIAGTISQGQATWSMDMTVDYELAGNKPQRLAVDLRVGNPSTRSLTQYNGQLAVESTAYSYLNFESSFKYQRAQGHAECKLIVNTQPALKDPRHNFVIFTGFSIHKSYERSALNAFIEITKPISKIDLKLAINYQSQEEKSTTYLTLRYATGKEIIASLALSMPRSDLLRFNGKLNVTLPNFVPMIVSLKINEKTLREYELELEGRWFSGHNATAVGIYSDKSEGVLKSHYLKLFIQSPSFEDIIVIGRYITDEHQFKIELQAEHVNDKYGVAFKHATYGPGELEVYAEIRYKASLYSVTTLVNLHKDPQIVMELHLDKHRDIHITLSGLNTQIEKQGGIEVKWDANRDPGQRFAGKVRLLRPHTLNYSADASISYPGRLIQGSALFGLQGNKFDSALYLEWSPSGVIDFLAKAIYTNNNSTDLKFESQFLTPFDSWKRTSLSGRFRNEGNLVHGNSSVWWQDDQMVGVDLFWDYTLPDPDDTNSFGFGQGDERIVLVYLPELWAAFNASLSSTVPEVKPLRAAFSHRQYVNNLETVVHWQGKTPTPVMVKSCWKIEEKGNTTEVVGNMTLVSPYEGYQRGLLVGRINYSINFDVDGLAELNLDRHEYFGTIKGHITSLRDNMLVVNLTTPIAQYSAVTGRVGYSEIDRHLVCMWTMPARSLGVEIRLVYEHAKDFDLLFHLATPLEFFSKLLIVGKRKPEMIDVRLGFKEMVVGAEGSWRYNEMTDFDYRYTIFTPIQGLEETGLVAKIVVLNGFDVDLRVRVMGVKVGATVIWTRKTSSLRRVLLKMPLDSEEIDEEEEDNRWRGSLMLDTYKYPTITGKFDYDVVGSTNVIEGTLAIPSGIVYLYDEFYFQDMLTLKNDLQLITPFAVCSQLTSVANFVFVPWDEMNTELEIHVKSYNTTKKGGVLLIFRKSESEQVDGEEDSNSLTNIAATLQLHTPWEALSLLRMTTFVELSDVNTKTNLTIVANETFFTAECASIADKGFLRVGLRTWMTSPSYSLPEIQMEAKRDYTDLEKKFNIALVVPAQGLKYRAEGLIGHDPDRLLKLMGQIETPWEQLKIVQAGLTFQNASDEDKMTVDARLFRSPGIEFKLNANKLGSDLSMMAESPIEGMKKMTFKGTIVPVNDDEATIQGLLTADHVQFKVDTAVARIGKTPGSSYDFNVTLEPQSEGVRTVAIEVAASRSDSEISFKYGLFIGVDSVVLLANVGLLNGTLTSLSADLKTSLPALRDLEGGVNLRNSSDGWWLLANSTSQFPGFSRLSLDGNYWTGRYGSRLVTGISAEAGSGRMKCEYSWLPAENMALLLAGDYQKASERSHHAHADLFYKHPSKNLKSITAGLDFELDTYYRFGTNASIRLPSSEDVTVNLFLKLPEPGDIHSIIGKLRHTNSYNYVAHRLQYSSLEEKVVAGTSGEVSVNSTEIQGNMIVEWGKQPQLKAFTNVVLYKKPNNSHVDVQYTLHTPYFSEDTFFVQMNGDCPSEVWTIKGEMFAPRSNQLSNATLYYSGLDNINGTLHSKTPFPKLPYAGADFQIISGIVTLQNGSGIGHYHRGLKLAWPNNTAVVQSYYTDMYTLNSEGRTRDINGQLLVEIPLANRHVTNAAYNYQDAYPKSSGDCTVNYNGAKLLKGRYNCLSENRGGFNKDDVNVTLENSHFPLGVHYIHELHYNADPDFGTGIISTDRKWTDLFKLDNRTAFNLAGELEVTSLDIGKVIKVSAFQANNTINLKTDYQFLDHEFTHSSRLNITPTAWAGYNLHIVNKTTEVQEEGHMVLELAYPLRNFTLNGHIRQDQRSHESELRLDWDKTDSPKTLGAGFDWWRASRTPDQQVATLRFKHPSFVKDVTFNATYIRHGTKAILTRLDVDYSNITEKNLFLEAEAQDLSVPGQTLYQVDITGVHPATKLDLAARAVVNMGGGEYQARGDARYKRTFLSQQNGHLHARIDANLKELDFLKRLQHEESYLRGRFYSDEPCCTRLNGSLAKTDVLNYTGDFLLDIEEKNLILVVNMTPDATDQLQAHGYIPDTRNAEFNVWRKYGDLTVVDIACYLRLNHSRLVTSRTKWRPTLRKEIIHGLEDVYFGVLKNFEETADYWKDYIRSEVKSAISDIFENSKPHTQLFLDHLEDLKTLDNDFEELRTFLNTSYHRNDFYVKDVADKLGLLINKMELKEHLEKLPAIMGEIWQALGDSGEAIRQSIVWIVETIKNSYKKIVELIHQLLHGDSSAKLTSLIEEWISRYDRMVKELQLTVVRHVEQLYNSLIDGISEGWNNLLRAVEPTYIQIIHYMEDMAVRISQEILDFLYERKKELQNAPFLAQIANLTSDLEHFYKDIKERDIFTNIQDYSTKFYKIIKERYLTKIPFGKEIQQVIDEIIEGFKELEKLPSINYLVKKKDEIVEKVTWFWASLDLGPKLQWLTTTIHRRFMDMSANALQSENKYREAKTKFIFEPSDGLVLLEQKLPMSWHAFNETPKFEEIPEYRVFATLQSQLAFSNKTFWTFYYEYKPYTEIDSWFPPFKAQAIIAGSENLMTFDGRFLTFSGPCDYLLARDFVNDHFSLTRLQNKTNPDQFSIGLVSNGQLLVIDIFNNEVTLPDGHGGQLPAQIGHLSVFKEMGVITVEEKDGFTLQCNVLFHVCTLYLSGWYYGKTAGLLGTMDHEITSELLMSNGGIGDDIGQFGQSWALNGAECANVKKTPPTITNASDMDLPKDCKGLFLAKSSHYSTCFGRVNPEPFYEMCLSSRRELCSAAAAYVSACNAQYVLLSIPEMCVQCRTPGGKMISEGSFIDLRRDQVPMSADVVFIVEAKECNKDIHSNKNIDLFLHILAKELYEKGLKENRYSTVVFGGKGVFNKPRVFMSENGVFSTRQNIIKTFSLIQPGNGTEDIFEAIAFASTLEFRPGVSKIFVVIPCSSCDPSNMTMEYSVLRQVLLESNIRLHILMNANFGFEKQKLAKMFYGMDSTVAFTKKDHNELKGDADLRRQAKLPKSIMGYCAPLALETNGTVFAAKWMVGSKKNAVKKFASVFGKRVAAHAEPAKCQMCECTSYETGLGYMDCHSCQFPSPVDIDLGPATSSEENEELFPDVDLYDETIEEKEKTSEADDEYTAER